MIEIKARKLYDKKLAFEGELDISAGDCIGLVGNNGAGKTTLLRLITDLIQSTDGFVKVNGEQVSQSETWKKYTGIFLDDGFLIPFLTPREYLQLIADLAVISKGDLDNFIKPYAEFLPVELFQSATRIQELSKGNKNKVGILGALLIQPSLLILDEPFANLDPKSRSVLVARLKLLNAEGMTMIVSSHDLHYISEISTRTVLLDSGKVIMNAPTTDQTVFSLEAHFSVE